MKFIIYSLVLYAAFNILTGCATIVGGSYYYAKVQVPDHPNAKIEYNGVHQGIGKITHFHGSAGTHRKDGDLGGTGTITKIVHLNVHRHRGAGKRRHDQSQQHHDQSFFKKGFQRFP